jgi:hypothetical protein
MKIDQGMCTAFWCGKPRRVRLFEDKAEMEISFYMDIAEKGTKDMSFIKNS